MTRQTNNPRKVTGILALAAAAAIVLAGCSEEHDTVKASDLGINFAYSLAEHNGEFCDLLETSNNGEIEQCRLTERDQAAKQAADPRPIMWSPKVYQLLPGKENVLGILVEFNRAGKQEFVAIEAVRRGDAYKILRWDYPDPAAYRTDRAITDTFGW